METPSSHATRSVALQLRPFDDSDISNIAALGGTIVGCIVVMMYAYYLEQIFKEPAF